MNAAAHLFVSVHVLIGAKEISLPVIACYCPYCLCFISHCCISQPEESCVVKLYSKLFKQYLSLMKYTEIFCKYNSCLETLSKQKVVHCFPVQSAADVQGFFAGN